MPRVCRSAHHSAKANPMKAAVIAATMMAVSVVIVESPLERRAGLPNWLMVTLIEVKFRAADDGRGCDKPVIKLSALQRT